MSRSSGIRCGPAPSTANRPKGVPSGNDRTAGRRHVVLGGCSTARTTEREQAASRVSVVNDGMNIAGHRWPSTSTRSRDPVHAVSTDHRPPKLTTTKHHRQSEAVITSAAFPAEEEEEELAPASCAPRPRSSAASTVGRVRHRTQEKEGQTVPCEACPFARVRARRATPEPYSSVDALLASFDCWSAREPDTTTVAESTSGSTSGGAWVMGSHVASPPPAADSTGCTSTYCGRNNSRVEAGPVHVPQSPVPAWPLPPRRARTSPRRRAGSCPPPGHSVNVAHWARWVAG